MSWWLPWLLLSVDGLIFSERAAPGDDLGGNGGDSATPPRRGGPARLMILALACIGAIATRARRTTP
jgi:hypothetical protein